MGIRQSAQPLGVAVAAVTLPALGARAARPFGSWPASPRGGRSGGGAGPRPGAPAVAAAATSGRGQARPRPRCTRPLRRSPAGPWRRDPSQSGGLAASPYHQPVLWRIHAASALLVVSQFTVATFALVFLTVRAAGPPPGPGGYWPSPARRRRGPAARGYWSGRAGSRMRPMRLLAVSTAVGMLALAAAAAASSPAAVVMLLAGPGRRRTTAWPSPRWPSTPAPRGPGPPWESGTPAERARGRDPPSACAGHRLDRLQRRLRDVAAFPSSRLRSSRCWRRGAPRRAGRPAWWGQAPLSGMWLLSHQAECARSRRLGPDSVARPVPV